MFFAASKIVPEFFYPLGLAILALILASLLATRSRLRRIFTVIALALLFSFSTWTVSHGLLGSLESQTRQQKLAEIPVREAIVAISGFVHTPSAQRPTAELMESSDRLLYATRLYRARKAPLLLLSGGSIKAFGHRDILEVVAARDLCVEWGVPTSAILLEDQSRNTEENARFCRKILDQKSIRRIILVTSALHMPRAQAVFRKAGLDVTPAPTDFLTGWGDPNAVYRYLPDAEQLHLSSLALKEWLGLAVYRLRGWA